MNLIPTSTGAVRVPVEDGSLTDLSVQLSEAVTVEQVNRAFADAAAGPLKGILRCTTGPIVSHDIIGDPVSCIFDAQLTQVQDHLVKVSGWYDDEWGYTSRLVDLTELVAASL